MKKILYKILFLLLLLPINCYAQIDINKEGNIKINYLYDNVQLSDVLISVYKIGNIDSEGNKYISNELSNYNLNIDNQSETNTNLILSYIKNDNISPYRTINTNNVGYAYFNNLPLGVYLIEYNKKLYNGYIYTSNPIIVNIPNLNYYDIEINPKINKKETAEKQVLYITRHVTIGWNDNENNLLLRPSMIVLKLLRDGIVYKEARLSEENNWSYTWDNLPVKDEFGVDYVYTVVMSSISNYKTSLYQNGNSFSIIYEIDETTIVDDKEDTFWNNKRIPDISILWWPIPILFLLGFILLLIGILKLYYYKKNSGKKYILISTIFLSLAFIILIYNLYISFSSKKKMENVYNKLNSIIINNSINTEYKNNKYIDLPVTNIDNYNYSGFISIPSLNYVFPILDDWDNKYNLPVKLYGTPYLNNLYICSKNYYDLYKNLKKLNIDDIITFTDLNGNIFKYKVEEINIINNKDIYSELDNNSGFMLFTSEIYGINKVLVINSKVTN